MKKELFFLSSFALMTLASCSSDENDPTPGNPSNEIRVATEVTMPQSRAGYTTETLREFGLIIASGNDAFTYNNKRMTGGPLEGWTTDQTMYWAGKDQAHTVIAYAPYRDAVLDHQSKIDVKVSTDQSTAESVTTSDFIAMKNGAFTPSSHLTDGKLLVKMDHILTKVFVKLTYPEAYASTDGTNPVTGMTVEGMKVDATFDFSAWDGSATSAALALNGNGALEAITPFALSHDATNRVVTYEFIAIPQEQASIGIKFNAGGTPYTWTYDNLKQNSGEALTITLSVDKQGVQLGGDVTVGEWNVGGEINGGQPSEGAEPYTIEELNDKANWSCIYGSPRARWFGDDAQPVNVAFDGTWKEPFEAWFSHAGVQGVGGCLFGPEYEHFYMVLDLGKTRWLAGYGAVTAGYSDTTFGKVEFYVTAQTEINSDFTDDEKTIMFNTYTSSEEGNESDKVAYRSSMASVMDKANALDKTIEWVKLGEVTNDDNMNNLVRFDGVVDKDNLDNVVKSRYVKVVIHPLSITEHPGVVGNRVSLGEIYLDYVSKRNGVVVD